MENKITTPAKTTVEVRAAADKRVHLLLHNPGEVTKRIGEIEDGGWLVADFVRADIGPDVLRAIADLIERGYDS